MVYFARQSAQRPHKRDRKAIVFAKKMALTRKNAGDIKS